MIARTWRGWTNSRDADEYVDYLQQTGMRGFLGTPGNLGAYILKREDGDRTEFVTMAFFGSLQDVEAFAGEDVDVAVFYPEDDRFLVDREVTVTHYEVIEGTG